LECGTVDRGGGKGGGIGNDADERFRRGNGSVFPFDSNSSIIAFFGRIVVIDDDDGGARLPFDVVNIVSVRFFRFGIGLFGRTGN